MEILFIVAITFNFLIALYFFLRSFNSKKDLKKEQEAKRYFNGSIITKDSETYKAGCYTKGLTVKKRGNKASFFQQAKVCDTGLLY